MRALEKELDFEEVPIGTGGKSETTYKNQEYWACRLKLLR
jgi:hypothetical protein